MKSNDAGAAMPPAPMHPGGRGQDVAPTPGGFAGAVALVTLVNAALLSLIIIVMARIDLANRAITDTAMVAIVIMLVIASGFAAWWLVRSRGLRHVTRAEADTRANLLMTEIAAHQATDAALHKAKDAAEAASLAKSRYLVGVSHEIRSPLNAIYGYAQLLERGADIAPQDAGSVIRRSAEHLTNIVDGLLDISRIESGVLKLNRDIVPLPAVLEALVAMFRMEAANKGLQFHYQPAPNLPAFVRTDEKRLRQILINLLSNAVKYTPTGSITFIVRYRGLIAEFDIVDTGIGIPADEIERIFEPFERGSADAARAQPGTGLGLAITRVLAQIMGGDIAVTSTPGVGSIFKLRLMLTAPGDAVAATARQRVITGYAGHHRTILVIDDDPLQLAVLQGLLRPLGFSVFAAANGPEGIDLALRCGPDLVLLDIQMPGMSGWDVAARLRAIAAAAPGAAAPLKIVLVSANAHEFAAGGDGGAAHDGFVVKPVELEALLDVIAAQLGLAWIADHVPAEGAAPVRVDPAITADRLAELRRLGQVGHVRGIEAALTAMAAEVPGSGAMVDELRHHVRAFDLGGFLKRLDADG